MNFMQSVKLVGISFGIGASIVVGVAESLEVKTADDFHAESCVSQELLWPQIVSPGSGSTMIFGKR